MFIQISGPTYACSVIVPVHVRPGQGDKTKTGAGGRGGGESGLGRLGRAWRGVGGTITPPPFGKPPGSARTFLGNFTMCFVMPLCFFVRVSVVTVSWAGQRGLHCPKDTRLDRWQCSYCAKVRKINVMAEAGTASYRT